MLILPAPYKTSRLFLFSFTSIKYSSIYWELRAKMSLILLLCNSTLDLYTLSPPNKEMNLKGEISQEEWVGRK